MGGAELMEVAAQAATAVGDLLRSGFRTRPEVGFKRHRGDLVTEYDRRAEARIREVLLAAEPNSRIVGEEGGAIGDGRIHWYVDPIDGTTNFAHGLPYFCTSVAAVIEAEVVAGAIYDPIRDDLFTASLSGAWCNGRPIASVGSRTEAEAMLLFGPGIALADQAPAYVSAFAAVRITGSAALNLAHVAAGWGDVYLAAGVEPWDVAAGSLLVAAAGGTYRALWRGDPAGPSWTAPGCLATVGTIDLRSHAVLEAHGWRVSRPGGGRS